MDRLKKFSRSCVEKFFYPAEVSDFHFDIKREWSTLIFFFYSIIWLFILFKDKAALFQLGPFQKGATLLWYLLFMLWITARWSKPSGVLMVIGAVMIFDALLQILSPVRSQASLFLQVCDGIMGIYMLLLNAHRLFKVKRIAKIRR